ncbi:erythromycin esterase family protein [Jejuia pallidilutea]|nr:erythromycin esterase family protein [Jejuia pallidilutea]GAL72361.1 succinoglycan biosynthesis protein [Jejuia pallidilutea]
MMRLCLFLLLLSYSVLSQNVSKEELGYLINKSIPLSLNHPTEQWHKLDKSLNNKKMVLLGECNHGSREIFLLKNNFIQHLNKTLDYDVILFESGLAEMIDYYEDDNIPVKQLSHVWETEAFEALLKYAKDQNMEVAGFDVFVTGDSFQKRLDKILDNLHPNIEKEYNLVLDSLKNRNVPLEHIADKANHIINIYKTYSSALLPKSKIEKLTKRGIENRIATLHYMLQYKKDTNFPKQLAARDSLMAANINWLMTEIYPNKKAIVYTHNIHASKYNKYEE